MASLELGRKPTCLLVDHRPEELDRIGAMLQSDYALRLAPTGDAALRLAAVPQPADLIVLDQGLPDIDGFEVCRRLKQQPATRGIPVLLLIDQSNAEHERRTLECGAADLLGRPFSAGLLLLRAATQIALHARAGAERAHQAGIVRDQARDTAELLRPQDVTILSMALLAETRDPDTANHLLRTQHYVRSLAHQLRLQPGFQDQLDDHMIDMLFRSAPLHDIGKVAIPDRVLLNPGKLSDEEYEIMKTHTTLGRDAIERVETALQTRVEFLAMAKEIALSHQEKWDGSGYPQGLRGTAIPLSARLMSVADVYDALISQKIYKDGVSHEQAMVEMMAGRGRHFDPDIVDALLDIQAEIRVIAQRFADSALDLQKKMEYMANAIAEPS